LKRKNRRYRVNQTEKNSHKIKLRKERAKRQRKKGKKSKLRQQSIVDFGSIAQTVQ
jgi:hypothetical protein